MRFTYLHSIDQPVPKLASGSIDGYKITNGTCTEWVMLWQVEIQMATG